MEILLCPKLQSRQIGDRDETILCIFVIFVINCPQKEGLCS